MVEKSIKKKKYCLFTYGCTFNFGDSAKIQKILEDHSFEESDLSEAEYIIFNTCAVKHATEAKTLNFIKKNVEKYPSKKFIIGGCLPQIDKKIEFYLANLVPDQILIISPHNIAQIYEEIQKKWYLNLGTEIKSSYNRDKSYLYPKIKNKNSPAIIQISEGCNNHCAYCCTRIARGKLISFNPENIIIQIEKIASQGVKEFHLTSEDLGNYNYNGMLLHHLLKKISDIKGDLLFRLGMLNPDYLVKYCDEFLDIFSDKRFYRFIHMPIQSASNEILKKMYRNYNQEEIVNVVQKIQNFDKKFTFATDIIVGFPTETDEDHEISLKFIQWWKPLVLNISKYSVRPNTAAKKLPQLSSQIIKKRSIEFSQMFSNYSTDLLKKWLSWEGIVYYNEFHQQFKYQYMGRNQYYIPIISKQGKIGEKRRLRIIGLLHRSLIGE